MKLCLVAALALLTGACSSTPQPQAPSTGMDKAVAGVVLAAHVVHTADVACASVAATLRTGGNPAEAEKVSGKCALVLRDSVMGLDVALDAIETGKAVESKQVVCALMLGLKAVTAVRPILDAHGVSLGATADNLASFVIPFIPLAASLECAK